MYGRGSQGKKKVWDWRPAGWSVRSSVVWFFKLQYYRPRERRNDISRLPVLWFQVPINTRLNSWTNIIPDIQRTKWHAVVELTRAFSKRHLFAMPYTHAIHTLWRILLAIRPSFAEKVRSVGTEHKWEEAKSQNGDPSGFSVATKCPTSVRVCKSVRSKAIPGRSINLLSADHTKFGQIRALEVVCESSLCRRWWTSRREC